MKRLQRLVALFLCLLMCAAVPARAENVRIGKLTEDLSLLDAVTVLCAIAENYNATVDFTTLKVDAAKGVCTIRAGAFTLSVATDASGVATAVGVSAAYLDADFAQQMGAIFGMMLSTFSDVKSLATLNGIDFNAFNTLKASQQSVISGAYKITMAVDPDSSEPYSFTLALNAAVPVTGAVTDPAEEARLILGRMNIDVSAAFLYDEKSDLNGKLGAPGSYYSKINFARSALAPNAAVSVNLAVDQGGSIELFATSAEAIARSADVQSKLPLVGSSEYHFVYGSALLRLSGDTTPEDVGRLVSAFITAVNGDMAPGMNAAAPAAATPRPTATPAPVGNTTHLELRVKSASDTSVSLQWNTRTGATYKVEYRTATGSWHTQSASIAGNGRVRSFSIPALTPATGYEFRVTETVKSSGATTVATLAASTAGAATPVPYTATPKPTSTPKPTATPRASVRVGDKVIFGSYEQDGKTSNGQEPIEWLVLEVKNGEALLISVYALDVYNTYWGSPTWDNSTLRTWMNGAFYNKAFTSAEKAAIVTSTVKADKHPYYTSNPGKTTYDKVFCLSYVEANTLLTAAQRKCTATTYARSTRKVYTEGGRCYWWLRTPGKPGCGASIVCTDGSYDYDASYDGFCYGVRPCIRVPADSPLLGR